MKRFFKLNVFALAALLFLGVADAWGLGINRNVALNLTAEVANGNGTWNSSNKQLSWKDSYSNLFFLTDWYNADLSTYDKMIINVSNANTNKAYRVVIRVNDTDFTASLSGKGTKELNLRTDFKNGNSTIQSISGDPLKKIQSIRIGGNSTPDKGWGGRTTIPYITISSISFHKTVEWNSNGRITFYATDFNIGTNVTAESNKFTFSKADASISLDFDGELSAGYSIYRTGYCCWRRQYISGF